VDLIESPYGKSALMRRQQAKGQQSGGLQLWAEFMRRTTAQRPQASKRSITLR
jgi:hypothetical protein